MADSNVTKRALATAMKQLMAKEPFSKISVGDICQVCQMNRKSFYYHFRDKYDLVNWIFQTEFLTAVQRRPYESTWALIRDLCEYFYENRAFYHNALSVEGQNSFQDYFREILAPVVRAYAEDVFDQEGEDTVFFINFFSDALIAAMLRWLSSRNCMPPDRFTRLLRQSVLGGAQILGGSRVDSKGAGVRLYHTVFSSKLQRPGRENLAGIGTKNLRRRRFITRA